MVPKLFDNIMQVISITNTSNQTTKVSAEIDFELPRGYVAKLHKVVVNCRNFFDQLVLTDQVRSQYCLLVDPDDALTTQMPNNTVEHDVVLSGEFQALGLGTGEWGWHEPNQHIYDFSFLEGLDIISARNMRWNTVHDNTGSPNSLMECVIYYTLEEIKDNQIMELLDIL